MLEAVNLTLACQLSCITYSMSFGLRSTSLSTGCVVIRLADSPKSARHINAKRSPWPGRCGAEPQPLPRQPQYPRCRSAPNKKGVPISCVAPRTAAKGHKRTAPSRHSLFKEARFPVPLRLFKNLEDSGGGFSWKRPSIILSNPTLLASLFDATLNPRICLEQLRPDTWHFGASSVRIGARFAR